MHIYSLGSFLNIGIGLVSTGVAFGASYTINKLAHQIFGLTEDSYASKTWRAIAASAGIGASYYLAQNMTFISYSLLEVGVYLAIDALILLVSIVSTETFLSSYLSPGAALGWVGRPAIILTGMSGAAFGSLL